MIIVYHDSFVDERFAIFWYNVINLFFEACIVEI